MIFDQSELGWAKSDCPKLLEGLLKALKLSSENFRLDDSDGLDKLVEAIDKNVAKMLKTNNLVSGFQKLLSRAGDTYRSLTINELIQEIVKKKQAILNSYDSGRP